MQGDFARTFEGRLATLGRANKAVSLEGSVDLVRLLSRELIDSCGDLSRFHPEWTNARHQAGQRLRAGVAIPRARVQCRTTWRCPFLKVASRLVGTSRMICLVRLGRKRAVPWFQRPLSHGVGNSLIKHTVAKLDGTANLLYMPSGFRYELRVSLSACWPKRRAAILLAGMDLRSESIARYGLGRMG